MKKKNCVKLVCYKPLTEIRLGTHFNSLTPKTSLPLFLKMALSAGTPIHRGYLADLDCRWSVIAGSVDDRTPEERGLEVS